MGNSETKDISINCMLITTMRKVKLSIYMRFLKDATLLFSVHKEFVFACQLGLDFDDLLVQNLVAWLHS